MYHYPSMNDFVLGKLKCFPVLACFEYFHVIEKEETSFLVFKRNKCFSRHTTPSRFSSETTRFPSYQKQRFHNHTPFQQL